MQVSAYSPRPLLEGLTHPDARAASSSLCLRPVSRACVLAHPAPSLLMALPTQPPWTSVQRPSHTSPSASPALESANSSTALALALLQQLQGRGEASGVGENWKVVARKLPHHLHARPGYKWMQRGLHSEGLLPGPTLSIFHGRTTHLTALRNSLEERHTKQSTSHPSPVWFPLASRAATETVPAEDCRHGSSRTVLLGPAWLQHVLAHHCNELQLSNSSQSIPTKAIFLIHHLCLFTTGFLDSEHCSSQDVQQLCAKGSRGQVRAKQNLPPHCCTISLHLPGFPHP